MCILYAYMHGYIWTHRYTCGHVCNYLFIYAGTCMVTLWPRPSTFFLSISFLLPLPVPVSYPFGRLRKQSSLAPDSFGRLQKGLCITWSRMWWRWWGSSGRRFGRFDRSFTTDCPIGWFYLPVLGSPEFHLRLNSSCLQVHKNVMMKITQKH